MRLWSYRKGGDQKDGLSNLKRIKKRADVSHMVFDAVLEEFFNL